MFIIGLLLGAVGGGLAAWTILGRIESEVVTQLEAHQRNSQRARILAEEQLVSHRARSNAQLAMLQTDLARCREALEQQQLENTRYRAVLAQRSEQERALRAAALLKLDHHRNN